MNSTLNDYIIFLGLICALELHDDFIFACAFDYIGNLNKISCMLSLANDNTGSTTNANISKELLTWILLLCLFYFYFGPTHNWCLDLDQ